MSIVKIKWWHGTEWNQTRILPWKYGRDIWKRTISSAHLHSLLFIFVSLVFWKRCTCTSCACADREKTAWCLNKSSAPLYWTAALTGHRSSVQVAAYGKQWRISMDARFCQDFNASSEEVLCLACHPSFVGGHRSFFWTGGDIYGEVKTWSWDLSGPLDCSSIVRRLEQASHVFEKCKTSTVWNVAISYFVARIAVLSNVYAELEQESGRAEPWGL